MKILIINEKLIEGGAEQSCLKMKSLLEQNNHEVYYLTFDNEFENKIKNLENITNIINIKTKNNIINKMVFNPFLYFNIKRILKKINPDKVILNNIFSSPITQLKSLDKYEVYQIVRDYTIVCPKSTAIKSNYSICKGYKYEKCTQHCTYHDSKLQLILKRNLIKRTEKLRKKIIQKVISPSENLNKYLLEYGYNSCCINNPVDIPKEKYKNNNNYGLNMKEYIYIGVINENKGIYKLLDVYQKFSKDKNVNLKIVGKCSSAQDEERLNSYLEVNNKIEFLGYKRHDETVKEIEKAHFIVVPSLWIENYPTTALEGMLYGTVVLGSNRGGIPEIIGNNRGMLFDILNPDSVLNVLEESYKMSEEDYRNVREQAYQYVINNNSFDKYYKRIIETIAD